MAKPTLVFARAGNAQAIVSWQASPGSNASTIYVVTPNPGSISVTTAASVLVATVTGLTNGVSYTFTVKAKNGTFTGPASAPSNVVIPTTWTRQFGAGTQTRANSVSSDSSDNSGVYVVGNVNGALPGQTYSGGTDAFLSKYNPSGTLLWQHQFGSSEEDNAFGVSASPSDQSVYVVGSTNGALPGQKSSGGSDAFLSKYDALGTLLWPRQFGSPSMDSATGVSADLKGDAYVAGWTDGTLPGQTSVGGRDAFLSRYDPSGSELWTRQFGTSTEDSGSGVSADNVGNVYLVGYTTGTLPGQISAGNTDAFLSKYDASGAPLWTRQFGSGQDDYGYGVAADSFGNVYVAGWTGGTLPLQASAGGADAFLRKYDASGNVVWTSQFGTSGNDAGYSVSADNFGNVYIVGYTSGALPGQIGAGDIDAFLRMYGTAGNYVWTRQFGSSAHDEAWGVSADNFGNVYAVGWTFGALPGQISAGGINAFLLK
ncbi:MAG: SBBP repeat-containing protein [Chloroflexi bacterium]|nr:SBBP repeat-containing protein [Chloroflexota bacterium]